ncbi:MULTISPECIES: nucleotide-binding protein [Paraburkholderia]|uniref:nucleotide-binding protein n=1 Tax=Paraburkholderia TaxID=1822464 RepID=UPI00225AA918|nr:MULTISPECIES: nucleotide-binding protein [Paraburkholderia]MCX4177744.1 nucleotide-binding protein [Paraburkholderia madseniana]MDQ6465731.1 nucleotide-binding protein [Paraburkholderia madseniana]
MSAETASQKLLDRIHAGEQIASDSVSSSQTLERNKEQFREWDGYNIELLRRMFTNDEEADKYKPYGGPMTTYVSAGGGRDLGREVANHAQNLQAKIGRLKALNTRIELYELDDSVSAFTASTTGVGDTRRVDTHDNRVFIVHGHDHGSREAVARVVETLGLEPIVLGDEANSGQTIIEKFERHAQVGFAIVLLTGDDVGGKDESSLHRRARQNVILELGYFIGRLSRARVCALYVAGVEMPSDIAGVGYVALDQAGLWKYEVAKELRAAGYTVDLNRL